jgi:hypothetical protein
MSCGTEKIDSMPKRILQPIKRQAGNSPGKHQQAGYFPLGRACLQIPVRIGPSSGGHSFCGSLAEFASRCRCRSLFWQDPSQAKIRAATASSEQRQGLGKREVTCGEPCFGAKRHVVPLRPWAARLGPRWLGLPSGDAADDPGFGYKLGLWAQV